jgi:hypothetical protein
MTVPEPSFHHLRQLTDGGGLYEHADGTVPRREHGYCVDDVARGLVVVCREPDPSGELADLRAGYLDFLEAAESDGQFRNRRGTDLGWRSEPCLEDCWGRAVWGLGTAVARADAYLQDRALALFDRAVSWQSPWLRATAFAGLGAAEVLRVLPDHRAARLLLGQAAVAVGPFGIGPWPWPETRLRYANAVLPEVLIAAGVALDIPGQRTEGLRMLRWLLDIQVRHGQLSVVPVAGRGPGEPPPRFDQQPIEVAALADACARAFDTTGDPAWVAAVELAASWFLGANDAAVWLYDPATGGGCDGLERSGRNENQGAESTLAALATFQQARRLALCPR